MADKTGYVLVVEDEGRVSAFVRHALELEGFGVATEHSAESAWGSLVREHPSVAVVDLGLPGSDGWSLIERMRQDPRFAQLPVLVMTGRSEPDIEERASELSCALLRKPFEPDDLLASVRSLMVRTLKVSILLEGMKVTGSVHVPPGRSRFSDAWEELMADDRRFIPVTDAVVSSVDGEAEVEKVPYLALAKDHVRAVAPLA